jgi:hypothetical protein
MAGEVPVRANGKAGDAFSVADLNDGVSEKKSA